MWTVFKKQCPVHLPVTSKADNTPPAIPRTILKSIISAWNIKSYSYRVAMQIASYIYIYIYIYI